MRRGLARTAWLLASLAGCLLAGEAAAQNETTGRRLYVERACAACHDANPARNVLGVRSAADNPQRLLLECATEPTMVGFCGAQGSLPVSAQEAADLAAFIANPASQGPLLAPSSSALVFQRRAGSIAAARRSVRVRNPGAVAAVLGTVTLQGDGLSAADYRALDPVTGNRCTPGLSLAPGADCGLDMVYAPAAAGTQTVTLRIAVNGFDTVRVALNGTATAVAAGALAIDTDPVDLGNLDGDASRQRRVTVANIGDQDLRLDAKLLPTLSGAAAADYRIDSSTCSSGTLLAADGGACSLSVRFIGSATADGRPALLSLGSASTRLQVSDASTDDAAAGGCALLPRPRRGGKDPVIDPLWAVLLALSLAVLAWRRAPRRRTSTSGPAP